MIFMFCDLHFSSKITPCLWIKINEFASCQATHAIIRTLVNLYMLN